MINIFYPSKGREEESSKRREWKRDVIFLVWKFSNIHKSRFNFHPSPQIFELNSNIIWFHALNFSHCLWDIVEEAFSKKRVNSLHYKIAQLLSFENNHDTSETKLKLNSERTILSILSLRFRKKDKNS